MDQQQDERESGGATRSQNVVYTLPHDWGVIPQFLAPALERIDRGIEGTQLLVVTPDAETALAFADASLALRDDAGARPLLVPVTRAERVSRLARVVAPAAIAGAPDALASLVRAAVLKLDTVRTVIFAWADEITAGPAAAALEAVLAELPKDAARVLVASTQTESVEALIERYLRRPRRVGSPAPSAAAAAPVAIAYLPVADGARPAALRRLLDELDPPSAAVLVTSDASESEALRMLRALGYAAPLGEPPADDAAAAFGPDVRVTRGAVPENVALLVLYDVPTDRAVLDRAAAGRPAQIVALARPRQLEALRALAGRPATPLALPDLARSARARDDALRAELRAALDAGVPHRELLALEPLLGEYDGVQVAAAAVRLLEQARTAAARPPAGASSEAAAPVGAMTRLFVTVGSKDGVRPGDLVGAIAGEAGISSERIGKIEVRDAFSLVEVASADAARVVDKVNGISIRGRRAMIRPEREGTGGGRDGGGRGAGPGSRGGERRAPAGDRRGTGTERRGPAGPRPGGGAGGTGGRGGPRTFDARSDGPRGFGGPDDRGVRERAEQRDEWAARAERLRRARRDVGSGEGGPEGGDADTTEG